MGAPDRLEACVAFAVRRPLAAITAGAAGPVAFPQGLTGMVDASTTGDAVDHSPAQPEPDASAVELGKDTDWEEKEW